MPESNGSPYPRRLRDLLRVEVRLVPRLAAVFRFQPSVYEEIERDSAALVSAFAVVIGTSILVGFGQISLAGVFLGVAGAIAAWLLVAALVWALGTILTKSGADYARLLRCLGFAYAWNALGVFGSLPWVGVAFEWLRLACWAVSIVLVTRTVYRVPTGRAVAICALALGLPLAVWGLLGSD